MAGQDNYLRTLKKKEGLKMIKKFCAIFLLFAMILCTPTFAANSENLSLHVEKMPISKYCIHPPEKMAFATTDQVGSTTQTKTVYMDDRYIGTVTLHYDLAIQGGRPQFVYETCGLTWSFDNLPVGYALSDAFVEYTGDRIDVTFCFSMTALITKEVTVCFIATGTAD